MVTILRHRQEERNAARFKMLFKKTTYFYKKERKENIILANSRFAGNFSVKGVLLTVYMYPFGWVEENRALFLVLEKSSHV